MASTRARSILGVPCALRDNQTVAPIVALSLLHLAARGDGFAFYKGSSHAQQNLRGCSSAGSRGLRRWPGLSTLPSPLRGVLPLAARFSFAAPQTRVQALTFLCWHHTNLRLRCCYRHHLLSRFLARACRMASFMDTLEAFCSV